MLLKLGITMLIHNKDDIEFVTEFPCFWDTLYVKINLSILVPIWQELFNYCQLLLMVWLFIFQTLTISSNGIHSLKCERYSTSAVERYGE